MTENEYIAAGDLARLRVALEILRECTTFQGERIDQAYELVRAHVAQMFLDTKLEESK